MLFLSQVIEATHALALVSESAEGFGYLLKDCVLEIDVFLDAVRGSAGEALRSTPRSSRSSSSPPRG